MNRHAVFLFRFSGLLALFALGFGIAAYVISTQTRLAHEQSQLVSQQTQLTTLAGIVYGGTIHNSPPLVYSCTKVAHCIDGQEFSIADAKDAPIFTVPEFGGPAVMGDNLRIFGPDDIYLPSLVLSYTSPAAYDAYYRVDSVCIMPSVWFSPVGIWHCAPDNQGRLRFRWVRGAP